MTVSGAKASLPCCCELPSGINGDLLEDLRLNPDMAMISKFLSLSATDSGSVDGDERLPAGSDTVVKYMQKMFCKQISITYLPLSF